jgi:hypothetical protein
VISAAVNLVKVRTRELHEYERPIAILAVQQAEMNRDKKKRRKPFEMDDFYLYNNEENKDSIDSIYGAAAVALIKSGNFPSWALFVYKELLEKAAESIAPTVLCYQCDHAILLAPQVESNTCKGMLIAVEAARHQTLEMHSPCGKSIRLRMPDIRAKVIAEENCYLDVVN